MAGNPPVDDETSHQNVLPELPPESKALPTSLKHHSLWGPADSCRTAGLRKVSKSFGVVGHEATLQ